MNQVDLRTVGLSIIALFLIIFFLIWDHPVFIVLLTMCFGVIGYIALRKEPRQITATNENR